MELIKESGTEAVKEYSPDAFINVVSKIQVLTTTLIKSEHIDVQKKVKELDLPDKLKEMKGLILDINNNSGYTDKQSIAFALSALYLAVEEVYRHMTKLAVKLKEHSEKWFSYWRTLEYNQEMAGLIAGDILMNKRYDRIKDLLKIW